MKFYPSILDIITASQRLQKHCRSIPLQHNKDLSVRHNAQVHIWRGDLEIVRSYKWRGAYNAMYNSNYKSVVTCSAGNHAQGVAYSCNNLGIKGEIFMPVTTTNQKIAKVKQFGGKYVDVFLEGANFDESFEIARKYSVDRNLAFVHPFDNEKVIEGQATVGVDIMEQMKGKRVDYMFIPVGGGGLCAGVSSYVKYISPETKIIGVEPSGAPSMTRALEKGEVVKLDTINSFVDGAAVKRVGDLNYPICAKNLDDMITIDEGHVCSKIIQVYNEYGIIIEPAGVLSLCALDVFPFIKEASTNVVSIISGGNSDVFRMPEILERALVYNGLKHYFKIQFAQRAGSLKEFVLNVLEGTDDIIYFRYTRLINRETGPVVIGLEVKSKADIYRIISKMTELGLTFEKLAGPE